MPVKLGSKLPVEHEARIEIIPLIDIMFFLLAAFMLVSLSLVNSKSVKVDLPTATAATADAVRHPVTVSVDRAGMMFVDRQPVAHHELATTLAAIRQTNASLRVLISGDREARHGDVIRALDLVRSAGIEKVAFAVGDPPRKDVP